MSDGKVGDGRMVVDEHGNRVDSPVEAPPNFESSNLAPIQLTEEQAAGITERLNPKRKASALRSGRSGRSVSGDSPESMKLDHVEHVSVERLSARRREAVLRFEMAKREVMYARDEVDRCSLEYMEYCATVGIDASRSFEIDVEGNVVYVREPESGDSEESDG